ncbi:transposase domain-containing protein, partial [Marinomonas sp.]|uniref:transposase domain-containing protein n=1 Tax=Marinomonas sp. TaxID=1904862 RepID=UPI003F9A0330
MKILPEDLPNDVEALKALLLEQALLLGKKDSLLGKKDSLLDEKDTLLGKKDLLLAEWQSKYTLILEQWRLAQQRQFGKSSEVSPGQGELFDEMAAELEESDSDALSETQTVSYSRTKPKRKPLPKDLPRETVVLDIAESDKVCSCC